MKVVQSPGEHSSGTPSASTRYVVSGSSVGTSSLAVPCGGHRLHISRVKGTFGLQGLRSRLEAVKGMPTHFLQEREGRVMDGSRDKGAQLLSGV